MWIGYSAAVVSQWTRGVYRGSNGEISRLILAWMEAHRQARAAEEPIRAGPGKRKKRTRQSPGGSTSVTSSHQAAATAANATEPTGSGTASRAEAESSPTAVAARDPAVAAAATAMAAAAETAAVDSEEIREVMIRYAKLQRISQHEVGKQVGYSTAVISQWMRGVYSGNNAEIERTLRKWIALRESALAGGGEEQARKVLVPRAADATGGRIVRWEAAEEAALLKLVAEDGARDWKGKAKALGTGRTASAIHQHWRLKMMGQDGDGKASPRELEPKHEQGQEQEPKQDQDQDQEAGQPAAAAAAAAAIAPVQQAAAKRPRLTSVDRYYEALAAGHRPSASSSQQPEPSRAAVPVQPSAGPAHPARLTAAAPVVENESDLIEIQF